MHYKRYISLSIAAALVMSFVGCSLNYDDSITPDEKVIEQSVKHVILFIADGTGYNSHVAGSRYLTGLDNGLSYQAFEKSTNVTTWDANTYGRHKAQTEGWIPEKGIDEAVITEYLVGLYDPQADDFNPSFGYDIALGGIAPYPETPRQGDEYFTEVLWGSAAHTGSGSAATAMATGVKTQYHKLSYKIGNPENGELTTIAEKLRDQKGFAIGTVSTVPFNHATPAAFVVHNPERDNFSAESNKFGDRYIAEEIVRVAKPDVVIAAGQKPATNPFNKTVTVYMPDSLKAELMADETYEFVEGVEGVDGGDSLQAAAERAVKNGTKLWGLFGDYEDYLGTQFQPQVPEHNPGNPTFSRENEQDPTLSDAVNAALTVLSQDKDGFFAIIEQGDIDWGNHVEEYNQVVGGIYDLHMAVKAATDFVERPGDDIDWNNTVIIVTSDHANGYQHFNPDMLLGMGDIPEQINGGIYGIGGVYPNGEVTYDTVKPFSHTNELVKLYATGAQTDKLNKYIGLMYPGTDIMDNTQIAMFLEEVTSVK